MVDQYKKLFLTKFLENLNNPEVHPGLIIASPSKENPDYFYHWIRDAGLCMSTVFKLYEKNIINKKEFIKYFTNYVTAEYKIQKLNTLSGFGEPKIRTNLIEFNENWGRPQNDSPALRCLTNMKYFNFILKDRNMFDIVDIRFFYNKNPYAHSLIKSDLEYVSHNYQNPCFDLWEEIQGYHFYTLMVQKKCMEEGAKIADIMFDIEAYKWYKKCENNIDQMLNKFYINGKIVSSFDKNWEILRDLDSSIFLAFLHTNKTPNSSLFNTIIDIMKSFSSEYFINSNDKYPLIGRYLGDVFYGGNPWILTTVAFCNILKKISKISTFNSVFNEDPEIISKNIINKIKQIHKLNEDKFNEGLSEQINKNNGDFIGAKDLTWNYSECLQYIMEYDEF